MEFRRTHHPPIHMTYAPQLPKESLVALSPTRHTQLLEGAWFAYNKEGEPESIDLAKVALLAKLRKLAFQVDNLFCVLPR